MASGRQKEAEHAARRLLERRPPHPKAVRLAADAADPKLRRSVSTLFKPRNRRAAILASVPWFLQDLGTYGIGIFTPTILAATLGHVAAHPATSPTSWPRTCWRPKAPPPSTCC